MGEDLTFLTSSHSEENVLPWDGGQEVQVGLGITPAAGSVVIKIRRSSVAETHGLPLHHSSREVGLSTALGKTSELSLKKEM